MALKSEKLFEAMGEFLKQSGPETVKKIQSVFKFDISEKKGGPVSSWTVNLKTGNGSIEKNGTEKPDATFTMLDKDLIAMASKTLNPQQAFMSGKMKIKGNMAKATKFTPDLLPPLPKL